MFVWIFFAHLICAQTETPSANVTLHCEKNGTIRAQLRLRDHLQTSGLDFDSTLTEWFKDEFTFVTSTEIDRFDGQIWIILMAKDDLSIQGSNRVGRFDFNSLANKLQVIGIQRLYVRVHLPSGPYNRCSLPQLRKSSNWPDDFAAGFKLPNHIPLITLEFGPVVATPEMMLRTTLAALPFLMIPLLWPLRIRLDHRRGDIVSLGSQYMRFEVLFPLAVWVAWTMVYSIFSFRLCFERLSAFGWDFGQFARPLVEFGIVPLAIILIGNVIARPANDRLKSNLWPLLERYRRIGWANFFWPMGVALVANSFSVISERRFTLLLTNVLSGYSLLLVAIVVMGKRPSLRGAVPVSDSLQQHFATIGLQFQPKPMTVYSIPSRIAQVSLGHFMRKHGLLITSSVLENCVTAETDSLVTRCYWVSRMAVRVGWLLLSLIPAYIVCAVSVNFTEAFWESRLQEAAKKLDPITTLSLLSKLWAHIPSFLPLLSILGMIIVLAFHQAASRWVTFRIDRNTSCRCSPEDLIRAICHIDRLNEIALRRSWLDELLYSIPSAARRAIHIARARGISDLQFDKPFEIKSAR
jgi:hypothetical protein